MTTIILLAAPDCGFCEHAKQVLHRVSADHPLTVEEVALSSERGEQLAAGWVAFAPGVLIDGRPFAFGRLSEKALRRALDQTSSTTTTTR